MPSAEQITQTVTQYLDFVAKGDADSIATLYAADATVEDPVGGEVHIGRQAIRAFYTAVENANGQADVETLRVLGHEAAFYWTLAIHGMKISIISVMTFDDEAKIASMKAYWGPENISTG
ncbi:SgcJ/EcaC family oxidoreductase [Mycobacterium sp. M26]|uniref:SgcJ/EcaC family oxidoreductase n=1 Tax=Mycobacterium sp. M26 TaxID=1762962 RepID=UPI00073F1C84|nr:SgcJ/EcaC family oxidoreductase [Mycobacterium sp. M26]